MAGKKKVTPGIRLKDDVLGKLLWFLNVSLPPDLVYIECMFGVFPLMAQCL